MSDEPRSNSPEDVGFTNREGGDRHAARGEETAPPPEPGPAASAASPAPAHHEPQRCRSCNAPLWWAQVIDEKGEIVRKPDGKPKVMPVDFAPSEKGNIALARRGGAVVARVLTAEHAKNVRDTAWALKATHTLRTAHFATCPQADSWRRS